MTYCFFMNADITKFTYIEKIKQSFLLLCKMLVSREKDGCFGCCKFLEGCKWQKRMGLKNYFLFYKVNIGFLQWVMIQTLKKNKLKIQFFAKHDKESSELQIFDKLLLINILSVICNMKKKVDWITLIPDFLKIGYHLSYDYFSEFCFSK